MNNKRHRERDGGAILGIKKLHTESNCGRAGGWGRGVHRGTHNTIVGEKRFRQSGKKKKKQSESHQRLLECVLIHHLPDAVWILVDVLGLGGAHGERLLDS